MTAARVISLVSDQDPNSFFLFAFAAGVDTLDTVGYVHRDW
jgi:hypothetical protein